MTDNLTFRNKKCANFYLEEGTKNKSSLTNTIKSGDWDVFIHMPYNYSSVFSYFLQSPYKLSSKGKENKKKEEP